MAEFKRKQGEKARKDGKTAEIKAAIFLSLKGYRILEKNFRPPRGSGAGEIDLIALKSDVLVFVEVKLRKNKTDAAESVSYSVRQRRIRGALYFLSLHPEFENFEKRFDVILMTPFSLPEHIKNAFQV